MTTSRQHPDPGAESRPTGPALPSISIVIPAYNASAYLGRSLTSALQQSHPPTDITVVNDGSSDDSLALARTFAPAVQVIDLGRNRGVSVARNTGVAASRGDWILCLDADDVLEPNALRDFTATARQTDAGVIFGNVDCFDESTGTSRLQSATRCEGPPPQAAREHLWGSAISTPGAAVVQRRLHDRIGGYEKPWQPTEDRDYWLKCGALAAFKGTGTTVLRKYRRPDSMVRKFSDKAVCWGLRVQIEFIDWCQARGIDTGFIRETPREFATKALARCIEQRDWRVAAMILTYTEHRRIPLPWKQRLIATTAIRGLDLLRILTGRPRETPDKLPAGTTTA